MPRFVIERDMEGAEKLSEAELRGASQNSCSVLGEMGPRIQWVQSFVTPDKIYCVYLAPDEDTIREHARRTGLPANRVARVFHTIDPTTAE